MPTGVCFGLLPHKNTVAPNPSSNHKESLKPGLLNKHITRDEELLPRNTWKGESKLPCNIPHEENCPRSLIAQMPQLEALYALRERT
jgi:hypothetical protein